MDQITVGDAPSRADDLRLMEQVSGDHVSTSRNSDQSTAPAKVGRRRKVARGIAHGVSWGVAIPLVLFLGFYLFLLVRPIPLPFVGSQARAMVL